MDTRLSIIQSTATTKRISRQVNKGVSKTIKGTNNILKLTTGGVTAKRITAVFPRGFKNTKSTTI